MHSTAAGWTRGTAGALAAAALFAVTVADAQEPGQVHAAEVASAAVATSLEDRLAAGKRVYETACLACHQADGRGLPGAFPPLANSDYLLEDPHRGVVATLAGLQGKIVVNGIEYDSVMPAGAIRPGRSPRPRWPVRVPILRSSRRTRAHRRSIPIRLPPNYGIRAHRRPLVRQTPRCGYRPARRP